MKKNHCNKSTVSSVGETLHYKGNIRYITKLIILTVNQNDHEVNEFNKKYEAC